MQPILLRTLVATSSFAFGAARSLSMRAALACYQGGEILREMDPHVR